MRPTAAAQTDPPIIEALAAPLLMLRASLGSGASTPAEAVTAAVTGAADIAAATDRPHGAALHALGSSWDATTADSALPTLRTTREEIAVLAEHGPAYVGLLGDAHDTAARARRDVDDIITRFRTNARQALTAASAAPDADAVIDLAADAIRQAVARVTVAQSEMDDHTRRLRALPPATITTLAGYAPAPGQVPTAAGATPVAPVDPATAARMQLQQQLLSAGVQLGAAAIDAGAEVGLRIIDKLAEVGTHAIDAAGQVAAAAQAALAPGQTTPAGAEPTTPPDAAPRAKLFDFGPGAPAPGSGSPVPAPGLVIPDAPKPPAAPPKPEPKDDATPPPPSPPFGAEHPGTAGPAVVPSVPRLPRGGEDREHKPQGQLGVTVPAAFAVDPARVPAAVGA